jgi:hypothetical protein
MSKLMLGLVVIVLLALAVTTMFDKSSRRQEITQPVSSEVPAELTTTKPLANEDAPTEEEFGEQTARRGESSARLGADEPVVMPDQRPAESSQIVSPELNDSQPSSAQESASRPDLSLYTPEIAEMLDRSMPKRLQDEYESEEREDSWASSMEERLLSYLVQRLASSQFYIARVDCRTYICEIHLLGYGPDATAIWRSTTWDLINQPWHDFDRMFTSTEDVQPGVIGIAYMLSIDNY